MSIPEACRVAAVPLTRRSILGFTAGSLTALLPAKLALAMPAGVSAVPFDAAASDLTDLVLPDLEGSVTPLASFRGRPVLLHVFATWCEPCRDELPRLVAAARDLDLPLCPVSLAEPASRVRRFLEEAGLDLQVLIDTDRGAAKRLGLSVLPSTWILDRSLTPRFVAEGDLDWSTPETRSWLAGATT